jgi:hypothetical protein
MSIMSEPAGLGPSNPLDALLSDMAAWGIDLLLAFHEGAHFIEKPNAVMVLSGFKSLGYAMVLSRRNDQGILAVAPRLECAKSRRTSSGHAQHRNR